MDEPAPGEPKSSKGGGSSHSWGWGQLRSQPWAGNGPSEQGMSPPGWECPLWAGDMALVHGPAGELVPEQDLALRKG